MRNFIVLVTLFFVTIFNLEAQIYKKSEKVIIDHATFEVVELSGPNMEKEIKSVLNSIQGVKEVVLDLDKNLINVEFDRNKVSIKDIIEIAAKNKLDIGLVDDEGYSKR